MSQSESAEFFILPVNMEDAELVEIKEEGEDLDEAVYIIPDQFHLIISQDFEGELQSSEVYLSKEKITECPSETAVTKVPPLPRYKPGPKSKRKLITEEEIPNANQSNNNNNKNSGFQLFEEDEDNNILFMFDEFPKIILHRCDESRLQIEKNNISIKERENNDCQQQNYEQTVVAEPKITIDNYNEPAEIDENSNSQNLNNIQLNTNTGVRKSQRERKYTLKVQENFILAEKECFLLKYFSYNFEKTKLKCTFCGERVESNGIKALKKHTEVCELFKKFLEKNNLFNDNKNTDKVKRNIESQKEKEQLPRSDDDDDETDQPELTESNNCPPKLIVEEKIISEKIIQSESESKKKIWKCLFCSKIYKGELCLNNHIEKLHPDSDAKMKLIIENQNILEKLNSKPMPSSAKRRLKLKLEENSKNLESDQNSDQSQSQSESSKRAKINNKIKFKNSENVNKNGESNEILEKNIKSNPEIKCDHCDEMIKKLQMLKHLKISHPTEYENFLAEEEKYNCTVCNKSFHSKQMLNKHAMYHSEIRPFSCDLCLNKFRTRTRLREHKQNVHENLTVKCEYCHITIKKSYVREHNRVFHNEDTKVIHQCKICKANIASAYKLRRHMEKHLEAKCEVCQKVYQKRCLLFQHMAKDHPEVDSFPCRVCNKSFPDQIHLNEHSRIHKDKGIECKECGKLFKSNANLKSHNLRTHKVEKIPCKHCGAPFNVLDMKSHLKHKHYDEEFANSSEGQKVKKVLKKKSLTVSCNVCGKGIKVKTTTGNDSNYKQHMRVHSGEKPFTCKICDYKTSDQGNMNKHMKKHGIERDQKNNKE